MVAFIGAYVEQPRHHKVALETTMWIFTRIIRLQNVKRVNQPKSNVWSKKALHSRLRGE